MIGVNGVIGALLNWTEVLAAPFPLCLLEFTPGFTVLQSLLLRAVITATSGWMRWQHYVGANQKWYFC